MSDSHNATLRRRDLLAGGAAIAVASGVTGGAAVAAAQDEPRRSRFKGTVVLVTGATSGIGEGTAKAFAAEGAKVMFCGRRTQLGRRVEAHIRSGGGDATFVRTDVRDEAQVAALVKKTIERHGRLDIAFNNAGREAYEPAPLAEMSSEVWATVMATNASGVFYSMKHQLRHMASRGAGVIINNASISGHIGFATIAPYSASKHAIQALTKCGALEYSAKGVRICSVSPGAVDTPMLDRALDGFGLTKKEAAADYPINRIATVEEIADVVLFLASGGASVMAGSLVDVTGGGLAG